MMMQRLCPNAVALSAMELHRNRTSLLPFRRSAAVALPFTKQHNVSV